MSTFDLRQHKFVTVEDVESAARSGAKELLLADGANLTPLARDAIVARNLTVKNAPGKSQASGGNEWDRLFHSPEAEEIKKEIVRVGHKLWQRQYVDGNGGNISFRLTNEAVLCTPTLMSKGDLTVDDLCMVDMEGKQLAGKRPRSSEILLHLEIYKAVEKAKSVVHCHPAHATAYAITGSVPITCVIPEFEVFVGKVAISPYETPGTKKFAETVIPYVKDHNTVLLANHGIVCWADTVTHAEWFVEVVDTYCWTLLIARQLGAPITHISDEKTQDLLAIKETLGLPDARSMKECQLCDIPEHPSGITVKPVTRSAGPAAGDGDVEAIIQAVTEAVMASLSKNST